MSIDRATAIALSGAHSNSHIASSAVTGMGGGVGTGVVGGSNRRPSTAGPSLGSQATSDNTHTHTNTTSATTTSNVNLSGINQSKVVTERALSPLRDKNQKSKNLQSEQHGYGNRETGVKKDEFVLELMRSVRENDRRTLVAIDSKNRRKEWQDVLTAGSSGLFEKRKVILAANITKMARTSIMPKPRSAAAGNRKSGLSPTVDHTRSAQLFEFRNSTDNRRTVSGNEATLLNRKKYQNEKRFHFQDNSSFQKSSINSNACNSSTKEMDSILNEVHQQAIEPGFLF